MGHSVHTGVSGQLRGHLLGQLGINDSNIGSDVEVGQRILNALGVVGDYAERGNLSSSTGGGRNGAEVSLLAQLGEVEGDAQLLEGHIGVLVESPHSLGSVDGGTTAHGNDPVGLELGHGSSAAHNGLHRGIGLNVLKQVNFHAAFLQGIDGAIQEAKALHAAAAYNDESLLATQVLQFFQRTLAMIQIAGKSKTCHCSLPPKNTENEITCSKR